MAACPLIDHEMSLDETNSLSRNTSDEIFDFIFKECNDIKDKIIVDYSDLGQFALGEAETGRADKIAVLALRAVQPSIGPAPSSILTMTRLVGLPLPTTIKS